MYTLHVPGLREMTLRIEIGDTVQLRQLQFHNKGEVEVGSLMKDAYGRSVAFPRPQAHKQYNAIVWA